MADTSPPVPPAPTGDVPPQAPPTPPTPSTVAPRRPLWKRPYFLFPAIIVLSAVTTAGALMLL